MVHYPMMRIREAENEPPFSADERTSRQVAQTFQWYRAFGKVRQIALHPRYEAILTTRPALKRGTRKYYYNDKPPTLKGAALYGDNSNF